MKTHAAFKKIGLVVVAALALWPSSARASHCASEIRSDSKRVAPTPETQFVSAQSATEKAPRNHCPATKSGVSRPPSQDEIECATRLNSAACCCAPVSPDSTRSVLRAAPEMPFAIAATRQASEARFVSGFQTKSGGVLDVARSRGAPSRGAPRGPPVAA